MQGEEISPENKEKGERAEKLFEEYLNNKCIAFQRIDQNKDTRSGGHIDKKIQRPDYHVFTKHDNFHVDVKFRNMLPFGYNNEDRFSILPYKIDRLYHYKQEFHEDVWVAFTNNSELPQFNFINISLLFFFSQEIQNKYKEEYGKKYESFICVPSSLFFYDSLSLEYGFYNKNNFLNIDSEVKFHNIILEKKK
jgi:hypothetical protein